MKEELRPGTCALTKGEIEMRRYGSAWLVRYRALDGSARSELTANPESAHAFLLRCMRHLEHSLLRRLKN